MPVSFNKTFTKSEGQSHYIIFSSLFLDYDEAILFCDKNNIPYEFIVKTKYYVN